MPNPASATTLNVTWAQSDPSAAKSASYELFRYPTGATDDNRTAECDTAQQLDQAAMDGITLLDSGNLQLANVPLCSGASNPLDQGRCDGRGAGCKVCHVLVGEWRGLVRQASTPETCAGCCCRQVVVGHT